ncbi:hypothetical protein H4R34_005599 [Dimargaris verticillata]|uniref:Ankyrin n=1 Tax=Dimargaris verticillata TaxID=2761393 RepID=A0A9W8E702_9FUNG|nr:hypothetical protein H4R34_005599 [Dimargaris verticillata]
MALKTARSFWQPAKLHQCPTPQVSTDFSLHMGVTAGDMAMVKYSLDNGVAVDSVLNGAEPIHLACCMDSLPVLVLLLQYGARPNARRLPKGTSCYSVTRCPKWGSDSRARVKASPTPLHFAAANGKLALVRILLQWGAAVDVADEYGSTPIDVAAAQGHTEIVELLRRPPLPRRMTDPPTQPALPPMRLRCGSQPEPPSSAARPGWVNQPLRSHARHLQTMPRPTLHLSTISEPFVYSGPTSLPTGPNARPIETHPVSLSSVSVGVPSGLAEAKAHSPILSPMGHSYHSPVVSPYYPAFAPKIMVLPSPTSPAFSTSPTATDMGSFAGSPTEHDRSAMNLSDSDLTSRSGRVSPTKPKSLSRKISSTFFKYTHFSGAHTADAQGNRRRSASVDSSAKPRLTPPKPHAASSLFRNTGSDPSMGHSLSSSHIRHTGSPASQTLSRPSKTQWTSLPSYLATVTDEDEEAEVVSRASMVNAPAHLVARPPRPPMARTTTSDHSFKLPTSNSRRRSTDPTPSSFATRALQSWRRRYTGDN